MLERQKKKIILNYFKWVSDFLLLQSHLDNRLPSLWPNALAGPLQLDSNFLLRSVASAVANISLCWLIVLASWHPNLLQAPLMELKIPLAELILACSNFKRLVLLCMGDAKICAHKVRESTFFLRKTYF